MKAVGVLLAAVPFAFAGIRLFATGNDLRYIWMAVASTLCVAAVLVRPTLPTGPSRLRTAIAALAGATCAATVAIGLGATAGAGIAIVAAAFGVFGALGTRLAIRPPQPGRSG